MPESIGRLSGEEASKFSADIQYMQKYFMLGSELADTGADWPDCLEGSKFIAEESTAQFLPAIAMAVKHERDARQHRVLRSALLTIRQGVVLAGSAQQFGASDRVLHRDINGLEGEARMYVVSDINPTQFFPDITSVPGATSEHMLPSTQTEIGSIAFAPYEVVHASGMVYHRSPTMAETRKRTFMRLTYKYELTS